MTTPSNGRATLPKFPAMANRQFYRGRFLDGTAQAFFGPGQYPDVVNTYAPPTDWNAANTLLRVPQVVWLGAAFYSENPNNTPTMTRDYLGANIIAQGSTTTTGDGTYEQWSTPIFYFDEFESVHIQRWNSPHVPGTDPPDQDYTSPVRPPDSGYVWLANAADIDAEHTRIYQAFMDAKQTIEALRPGKTWLYPIDWYPYAGSPVTADNGYWINGDQFTLNPDFHYEDEYPLVPLLLPKPATTGYLGTDFLSIWVGVPGGDYIYPTGPVYSAQPWDSESWYPPRKASYEAYVPDFQAVWPMFAGFAAWIYGSDVEYSSGAVAPFSYPTIPPEYTDVLLTSSQMQAIHDEAITSKEQWDVETPNQDAYDVEEWQEIASDQADYGVTYTGTASEVTAESLVAAIAAHFKFDPATGIDLPVNGAAMG